MIGTKTLVVLTVPGAGKTWYKKYYEAKLKDESTSTLLFDMGEYDDKSIKEQELAFLNLIYITRKFHLESIIMANGSKRLISLIKNNDIPYITLIPKNRYKYSINDMELFENVMYMDRNSTFKNLFDSETQHLSDKIGPMWYNRQVTYDSWSIYDRKRGFI